MNSWKIFYDNFLNKFYIYIDIDILKILKEKSLNFESILFLPNGFFGLDKVWSSYCTSFISLLSIPGWFLIYDNPAPLRITFSHNLYNSILINSSIISFYLIPIFFCILISSKQLFMEKKKYLIAAAIFSIFFVFLLSNLLF